MNEHACTKSTTQAEDRPILLKQLASELGFHTSAVRKSVVRRGFIPFRLSSGENKPLYLSASDAEALKQQIDNERSDRIVAGPDIHTPKTGGVYFVEVPSYEGITRVKIGWSDNFTDRFSSYRTIVPDLRVKAVWQTNDAWCERAAIKCADQIGRRVHQELFEFDDNDAALSLLSDLFEKFGIATKASL